MYNNKVEILLDTLPIRPHIEIEEFKRMSTPMSTAPKSVPRRTIVKGAAWSIPVIMAAVAVPAQASSSKSKSQLRFDNWTANNSIAGSTGGITGNVGIQYVWIESGKAVTANIQVFVNGVLVLDKAYVLAPSQSQDNIEFKNTTPLAVGNTYQVDFILSGRDADGGVVETVSQARQVKIKF